LIDASCLIFSFAWYTSIRATMGKNGVVTSPWTSGGDGSRYSELGTIGSGAYGMVIKVKNVDTGEMVAVKKIVVPITSDGVPQSVIREVGLLKRIGEFPPHKNIVQMLQVMHGLLSPSELFINVAFEYCLCDLNTFLHSEKGKNLNMNDIRMYCLDILKGIQFLQQLSIIHRDIKPQNILLGKDGHLKLTDFGLARIYAHANLSPLVVTLWYRAPEILLVTTYTTAADIWSFACILAEMLKKTPLFPGDSEIDQLKKIFKVIGLPTVSEWPADAILPRNNFIRLGNTPLSTLFRDFEPEVIDLLKSVLTFNPDDRLNVRQLLQHRFFIPV
ncbi:Cyclin-dependent kinase 4, partial [Trichinella sp. T9]